MRGFPLKKKIKILIGAVYVVSIFIGYQLGISDPAMFGNGIGVIVWLLFATGLSMGIVAGVCL